MKKIFFASLALFLGIQVASAQTTVSGTVVDKKEQPIPGALVKIKHSNEYITTDHDGSFSIVMPQRAKKLEAQYVGYKAKNERAKDGMTIKMKKANWWNTKPDHGGLFGSLQCLIPDTKMKGVGPGLMLGYADKNVGLYAKGYYRPGETGNDYSGWRTGDYSMDYWGYGGGFLVRLKASIYLTAGYMHFSSTYAEERAEGWKETPLDLDDVGDLGLMINVKHLVVNAGLMYFNDLDVDGHFMVNVGIGYKF